MALVPKLDEVREFIIRHQIDIAFITETCMAKGVCC